MALEDDLIALESRVLQRAAGDFFAAVAELRRLLAAGDPAVARLLRSFPVPRVESQVVAAIVEAYGLGAQAAVDLVESPSKAVEKAATRVPAAVVGPTAGLDQMIRDAKRTAVTLLRTGAPVDEAAASLLGAANTVKSTVTTQVNEAANKATLQVAAASGDPLVWVNERDACVYCLSLAGHVLKRSGDDFPKADRFADGGTGQVTVQQPPLHPHCRCTLEVLVDESYAVALKREAERSILRGFSLQSESNAVRLRAAERLLADPNLVAPKSVRDYARRAVKAKQFPRGRDVPDGGPRLVVT